MTEKAYDFPGFGSNQWAIAPFKSANGRIIHVEHTHMPWANRFQNYEAHLITPGKLDAGGISWFGSPFFLDGFNDRITWSATWNEPNMADVYEEKINPENHLQYLYEGTWRDIRSETETFRVRGPKGMESITLPLYYTHHGPIVHFDREKKRAYSVKLPNYDGVNYSTNMYGLMKSRNLTEFKAALARQLMPRWNMLYTDSENIFWVHNGNVARRADGYDWSKPVPGWTKETEWGPYLPFEVYPQLTNPPSGFLQNCNNPPWVVTKNSGLNPLAPAPYYLRATPRPDAGEEALNTRGERLFQVLEQNKKFTLADMKELALDTYVLPADVIVPLLERAYAGKPGQYARVTRAIEIIKVWDRRSSEESVAYPYVYFWGRAYQELFSEAKFSRFVHYSRKKIDLGSAFAVSLRQSCNPGREPSENLGPDANLANRIRSHSTLHQEKGTDPKIIADQQGHGLGVHRATYIESSVARKRDAVTTLWSDFKALRSRTSVPMETNETKGDARFASD